MLLAVICALLVALWTSSRRLEQAKSDIELYRAELAKYRRELGFLDVTDPNKVHAIGVRTTGSLRWQWRIYLPQNRRFRLHKCTSAVPKSGLECSVGSWADVPSGEFLLDAYVERGRDGLWLFSTKYAGSASSTSIGGKDVSWLEKGGGWSVEEVRPEEIKVLEPDRPLLLLCLRVATPAKVAPDGTILWERPPDTPCDGLMVAIQEVK